MMYYSYILKSETKGTYYYGYTSDLAKRLKRHNSGQVRSTKNRGPWKLHFSESFETKSGAYGRELFYKSIDGYVHLKSNGII